MSTSSLVLLTLVVLAGPDPAPLVTKLGSERPAEREAASKALVEIGPAALPALRAAVGSKDDDVRERASDLIRKIEGDQLVRPTMVKLDIRDQPMSEIIEDLSVRTGCRLWINEERKDWLAARITLREPEPLPFWTALNRLCEAGRFQSNLGSGAIFLFRGEVAGPTSDHGAFRVLLEEIFYNGRYRRLHLQGDHTSRPIDRDEDRAKSYIGLNVLAEPRMMIRNDGPLEHLEVLDEKGQSLVPANPAAAQRRYDSDYTTAAYVLGQVPLEPVKAAGRTIQRLKGVAPVAVAARRSNPLVVPLAGSTGKPFRSAEAIVTIRSVAKVKSNPRVTVEPVDPETKRIKRRPANPEVTGVELTIRPIDRTGSPGLELSEEQFEIVDSEGKVWTPSPWWLSNADPKRQGGETHVRLHPVDENLSPLPWPQDLARVRLRYYDMTTVQVKVPFEFTGIALP